MTKAKDIHEALARRRVVLLQRLAKYRNNEVVVLKVARELKRMSTYGQEEE